MNRPRYDKVTTEEFDRLVRGRRFDDCLYWGLADGKLKVELDRGELMSQLGSWNLCDRRGFLRVGSGQDDRRAFSRAAVGEYFKHKHQLHARVFIPDSARLGVRTNPPGWTCFQMQTPPQIVQTTQRTSQSSFPPARPAPSRSDLYRSKRADSLSKELRLFSKFTKPQSRAQSWTFM